MTKKMFQEKERALEVSNIYALRAKQSPEKSFLGGGKVVLASPRQLERHLTPPEPKLTVAPPEEKLAIQQTPESVKPSPAVINATSDVGDFRQTIKSPPSKTSEPERESSALLDLSHNPPKKKPESPKNVNGLGLHADDQHDTRNGKEGKNNSNVRRTP